MKPAKRHQNDGVRKLCDCSRKQWSECRHSWYFNFKWKGQHYRFSLNKELGRTIDSKSAAKTEAEKLTIAIKEGRFRAVAPMRESLTLDQLAETYQRRYIKAQRADSAKRVLSQFSVILRTKVERADGTTQRFGDWLVADVSTDAIEQFQEVRAQRGTVASNRDLELLRHMFRWAVLKKLVVETPFKVGTEVAIKMKRESSRRRRLQPGEGERLLAVARPHLRAIIEAALETGCRRGELMTMQWWQVRFTPKAEIFLPASKTKTKTDRTIPMSSRLKAILEMRRLDPAGEEHKPQLYVFGNEVGEEIKDVKRAWQRAVLKAYGYTPKYVVKITREGNEERKTPTALLTPECQVALRDIDLHLHDLRRECGSRWLDAGVPLHRIKQWLGHANISQTSTYLEAEASDNDDAMRQFEARRALQELATDTGTPGYVSARSAELQDNQPTESSIKPH